MIVRKPTALLSNANKTFKLMKKIKGMEKFPPSGLTEPSGGKRVKIGIDPTANRLHLGHLVGLLCAKELQENGARVTVVIGEFTAQLGDPTGVDETRPILKEIEVSENAEKIKEVINRILNGKAEIKSNKDWLGKMSSMELLKACSLFSSTELLGREGFQKRIERGEKVGMHELIVPILQGLDSVNLNTEIEIGGADQLFNFKVSRDLQRRMGQKPEDCLLCPLIKRKNGVKMSKSKQNCIFLDEKPEQLFGQMMSCTDGEALEWGELFNVQFDQANMLDNKKLLASKITEEVWGKEKAEASKRHFEETIQKKIVRPNEIKEIKNETLLKETARLKEISLSEARRLIAQGGVKLNGVKISPHDPKINEKLKFGDRLTLGKRCVGEKKEELEVN